MEKKLFIILFGMVFLASSSALLGNDNVGTSCANFLKMGVGPRAVAMGGAFTALANDYTALYWNPAGMARMQNNEVGFSYTDWILDIRHSFVGAVYSPGEGWGTIGVSINYLDMGEMERTTPSEPNGTGTFFTPADLAVGLAYARTLTDRFAVGLQAKMIRESISFSTASTFALDLGTQFVTGFHGMRLGMCISNFGGKMLMMGTDQMVTADADEAIGGTPEEDARLETENWPLPMIFRFGVSFDFLNREDYLFTINSDFNDPRDMNPYVNLGGEFAWKNMVFLRGGAKYRPESFDEEKMAEEEELALVYNVKLSFGGGLLLQVPGTSFRMRLDYSYSENWDYGFPNIHRFSFSMLF